MTRDEARRIGIPDGFYAGFAHLTPKQAVTQGCADCGRVMTIHPDARWRFQNHVIRCWSCQQGAVQAGYTEHEAMFVV